MFYKTKINKNIRKGKSARNYCNDDLILMDGIWLMKGYPEPNATLMRTLNNMGDVTSVESAINRVLDMDFNKELILTPIELNGARAFYNEKLKQYHFINSEYLEMINLDKCRCISTDNEHEPVIFESTEDENQWLLVMPIRMSEVDKWLKRP